MRSPLPQWAGRRVLLVVLSGLVATLLVSWLGDLETRTLRCHKGDNLIAARLEYRKKRIREACNSYGYSHYRYRWRGDVFVDNIVWTRLPKVATTFMAALILRRMMNNSTLNCHASSCFTLLEAATSSDSRIHDELIGVRPDGPGGSLLIVRRPYDRLVSAFLDKIARDDHMKLWDKIKRISSRTNSTMPPTFSEFVDFVIWSDENDTVMDGHWDTQERLSRVCERDYQYIVQLETLEEELPYVLRRLGLETEARHPVTSRNASPRRYDTGHYLDQLTEAQLARLDAVYRMDIILFNG
ncbi:carbohydrate sulfotransferase 9-like [Amphibalanus amphitrite]|uniref:carbohydrate sulfotransferase 9-like n=1 Tax=Amphibalanus amphitrite TaxID=1232801 RepID=UPI001C8FB587|nr:carbohydrate sulfotransferase 9-like [Amphibalanus amphitrite]